MEQTFCFVDLAGFSALTEVHGDETGADLVERFTSMVRDSLAADGDLVAVIGDAAFLVFAEPTTCLGALERLWSRADGEPDFPALRAGVHCGEAARRGGQFYGTAVNVAARVAAHARSGQVLVTAPIAAAAAGLGLASDSLGVIPLKNIRAPLELFAIRFSQEDAPSVVDPICRMRVVPGRAVAHLQLAGAEHWFCSQECLRTFVSAAQ